jgi:hypothetical protein
MKKRRFKILVSFLVAAVIVLSLLHLSFERKDIEQMKLDLEQEKEVKERLAEDKDDDGLSFEEELELGTSDEDADTDDDGIPDINDEYPLEEGPVVQKEYVIGYPLYYDYWTGSRQEWSMTIDIPEDRYLYYAAMERLEEHCEYVTENEPVIKEIADFMLEKMDDIGEEASAGLAAAFMYSLPYADDVSVKFNSYPKYPIEVLADEEGDCADMSYLTVSLVKALGFDAVLFYIPDKDHMAVGIEAEDRPGDYIEHNGKRYYYLETSGGDWEIGVIPSDYEDEDIEVIECS